ncbi:hypothetical protein N752_23395 [Desulforamulus aquiferis]|nr:hypothetical protein N752_23395 [Desulforamulus aquiferis]
MLNNELSHLNSYTAGTHPSSLIIVFIPKEEEKLCKWIAAIGTGIALALSFYVYFGYDQSVGGLQWVDFGGPVPWIPDLGVTYYMAVDGLSLPMLLLTNLIGFTAVFASWNVAIGRKN